jgi:hypothetical protein
MTAFPWHQSPAPCFNRAGQEALRIHDCPVVAVDPPPWRYRKRIFAVSAVPDKQRAKRGTLPHPGRAIYIFNKMKI